MWSIAEQFQTMSTTVNNNTVYVGDIIQFTNQGTIRYGKVKTFFSKVFSTGQYTIFR